MSFQGVPSNYTEGSSGYTVPPPIIPDMFGRMEQMQQIRNLANQNALFQQTFQAKQRAGQIMAGAPDVATGLKQLQSDPLTASMAPELMNNYRQLELTNQQVLGEQQTQYGHAFTQLTKALPSAYTDVASFQKAMQTQLGTLPDSTRQFLVDHHVVENMQRALFDDLPSDPAQAKQAYAQRLNALMLGADFTPASINQLAGTTENVAAGGGTVLGMRAPPILGGGFTKTGVVQNTLAPTPVTGPYGPGGAQTTTVLGGQTPDYQPFPTNPLGATAPGGTAGAPPQGNALGVPAPGLMGPSQSQTEFNTKRAADIADYSKNLDDRVTNEAVLRRNVGEGVAAAEEAQTGGGAETYMKLGQALQAIGVKNDTVDKWANGSLKGSQVIDKLALQNSMAQLKAQLTGVGGSRLNAQEFTAYLNKNPNLTTDPRAAAVIFNIWQKFYDRDKAEQQAFDAFQSGQPTGDKGIDKISKGKDLKSWPALWNQSDYMKGFAPGGEIDTSKMKGIPKPVHPPEIQGLLNKYAPASTP